MPALQEVEDNWNGRKSIFNYSLISYTATIMDHYKYNHKSSNPLNIRVYLNRPAISLGVLL